MLSKTIWAVLAGAALASPAVRRSPQNYGPDPYYNGPGPYYNGPPPPNYGPGPYNGPGPYYNGPPPPNYGPGPYNNGPYNNGPYNNGPYYNGPPPPNYNPRQQSGGSSIASGASTIANGVADMVTGNFGEGIKGILGGTVGLTTGLLDTIFGRTGYTDESKAQVEEIRAAIVPITEKYRNGEPSVVAAEGSPEGQVSSVLRTVLGMSQDLADGLVGAKPLTAEVEPQLQEVKAAVAQVVEKYQKK